MFRNEFTLVFTLAIAACTGSADKAPSPSPAASGLNQSRNDARSLTVEGRIEEGARCPLLHTPDGKTYAIPGDQADVRLGSYVEITGQLVDTGSCRQGQSVEVFRIAAKQPPARDRDPARAGGLAVSSEYVQGAWVAKGVHADCREPDFAIRRNRNGGSIIEARLNGVSATGYVDVGETPALHWGDQIPALPMETRGPDGLAILAPQSGATVTLAGHPIAGDGVVFVKCAN